MKTNILKTEEILRVTYNDGSYYKLVKQSYTDGNPFFTIEDKDGRMPVETSNENLQEIISYLEKCVEIDRKSFSKQKINKEVKEIQEYCLNKQKELIYLIQEYQKNPTERIWGFNSEGLIVREHDKINCGNGLDMWNTHVLFDKDRNEWHRESDYFRGKLIGKYEA